MAEPMSFNSPAFRSLPPMERVILRSEWQGPCVVYTGPKNNRGYCTIGYRHAGLRSHYVHRLAWQLLVGPIPNGMTLDHLCRNKACWWPDHLEVVTNGENNRRGGSTSANHKRKTHCIRDHAFDESNTRIRRDGSRLCGTCSREKQRKVVPV